MTIQWKIKRFEELSTGELYQILSLRSEVFVVEQNCVYQDIDSKDQKAAHLLGYNQTELVAYARLFQPHEYFEAASIGRVVTHSSIRNKKVGHLLMEQAIAGVRDLFGESRIIISAQLYLKKFYEGHGFTATSATYLEDNIPHLRMERNPSNLGNH